MKLYISEKIFSAHRKFYVTDENNTNIFEISSKILSFADKTYIKNMAGEEMVYIEQQLFHLTPNYNIYINNNLVCNISKKFQLLKNDYKLDNGYRIDGKFMMFDFSIFDPNDIKIATIKRKFISIGDKYELTIDNEKDISLALAIVVAIANDINRNQR